MIIRKEISLDAPLTEDQKQMLESLKERPVVPDEDCPELTADQLGRMIAATDDHSKEFSFQVRKE